MRPAAIVGLTLCGVALAGGLIYYFSAHRRSKPPLVEIQAASSKGVKTNAEVMEVVHVGMTKAEVQRAMGGPINTSLAEVQWNKTWASCEVWRVATRDGFVKIYFVLPADKVLVIKPTPR